jgi:hypothetical protein
MANLFDASSSHSDTRSCLVAMGYSARRDHQHISTDDHSPVGICGIRTEQHGCNCRPARAEHINGHWRHREYLLALYHSTATLSANAAIEVSVLNDPRILGVDNPARNRRLLFVGILCGWVHHWSCHDLWDRRLVALRVRDQAGDQCIVPAQQRQSRVEVSGTSNGRGRASRAGYAGGGEGFLE